MVEGIAIAIAGVVILCEMMNTQARSAEASEIIQLARQKMWSEVGRRLVDLERNNGIVRDEKMCSVAVNAMAHLQRPNDAARYLQLMTPLDNTPKAALGALLKAYCLVDDLPRARLLLSSILLFGKTKMSTKKAGTDSSTIADPDIHLKLASFNPHTPPFSDETRVRFLSTYLRCCVRTGNMEAAGEAFLQAFAQYFVYSIHTPTQTRVLNNKPNALHFAESLLAGEALKMFGRFWLHHETCCFLIVRLLCLKLLVHEAW